MLFAFLLVFLDGLFRDTVPNDARELTTHQQVLERARRER
jgi:hypothetical protein